MHNINDASTINIYPDAAYIYLADVFSHILTYYDPVRNEWVNPKGDPFQSNYVVAWTFSLLNLVRDKKFTSTQDWFYRERDESGLWGYRNGGMQLESTARASCALLFGSRESTAKALVPAIDFLLSKQDPEGWWPGEFFDTLSNTPYYGVMLPISLALSTARGQPGLNSPLIEKIEKARYNCAKFLERRWDSGAFTNGGLKLDMDVEILSICWGARIYANVGGKRLDIIEAILQYIESRICEKTSIQRYNIRTLYNCLMVAAKFDRKLDSPLAKYIIDEFARRHSLACSSITSSLETSCGLIISHAFLFEDTYNIKDKMQLIIKKADKKDLSEARLRNYMGPSWRLITIIGASLVGIATITQGVMAIISWLYPK